MTKPQPAPPLPRKLALVLVALPVLFFLVAAALVLLFKGAGAVAFLAAMGIGSIVTAAGKFVVLGGIAPDAPIGPAGLALLVISMDTSASIMLLPLMPLLYRMPLLGKYLAQVQRASHDVLRRNRWMRRFTFLGLLSYVAVPFGGTGGVGAVILGRLLGLSRGAIVAGTFLGACIGAGSIFGLALLGQDHVDAVKTNPYLSYGALAVVVIATGLVLWRLLSIVSRSRAGGEGAENETPV